MVSDRKRHEAPPKKRVPKVFVQLLGPLKGTYNLNYLIFLAYFMILPVRVEPSL